MPFACPHCDETSPHRLEKYCPLCKAIKPHTAFHKNKSQADGLHGWCKVCRNAIHKLPEQQQRRQRLHRAWYERNQEHSRAGAKQWRLEHPEQTQETARRYHALPTTRAKKNAQQRNRYRKDPSMMLVANARRRAQKKHAPINDLTREQWEAIKRAYNFHCVYCEPTCKACRTKTHRLTQEHLTPLSKGGSHTVSNVVPACKPCNSRRNNREIPKPVQPLLLVTPLK